MKKVSLLNAAVLVAALGYFVDIYDLLLFSIVRVASLTELGYSGQELTDKGVLLIDMQMIGMLIGGILWGVMGDKRGRLSVLFGSIATYSLANIANGFVDSIESYAFWRFIAGIGLAGELGVGITLVTEIMPKETRGYGTTIVASIGIAGAVFAGLLADIFDWRTCYFIGGGLGLLLLALRIGVTESGMFSHVKADSSVVKGDFLALFRSRKVFLKYLKFILIGLPVWYVVGILVTFSPEFGTELGVLGSVSAGKAVMYCYAGLVLGDMVSGTLSQMMQSRRKVLFLFWSFTLASVTLYFLLRGLDLALFYGVCMLMGFSVGSWVVFMTIAAEQFGTNIRATVTTTVPNFVRGAVVPLTLLFTTLQGPLGTLGSGIAVGVITLGLAVWAISGIKESYGQDMDFVEEL